MIDLIIGCPVLHREWILDRWFDHIELACERAGVVPHYAFIGDLHRDRSFDVINRRTNRAVLVHTTETRPLDMRDWTSPNRYHRMVELRNSLLDAVRTLKPPAYLSLDSDILAHPDLVLTLLATLDTSPYDAVGGRCFMTPTGRMYPSWARLGRDESLQRQDADGLFEVDVIMAIKMMSSAAYAIDYEHHRQGEDIGWSKAARRAGLRLGWDGSVISKHVLRPDLLDARDPRVGF